MFKIQQLLCLQSQLSIREASQGAAAAGDVICPSQIQMQGVRVERVPLYHVQVRRLRPRVEEELAQGHTASESQQEFRRHSGQAQRFLKFVEQLEPRPRLHHIASWDS